MRPDQTDSSAKVRARGSANSQRIFPAVRRRDSPVYAQLASIAVAEGYADVTAEAIHKWVNAGLVPRTTDRVSRGRHGFATVVRQASVDQLLALCRLRAITKDWNRLRILLWLEGWPIEVNVARAAILAKMPETPTATERRKVDQTSLDEARKIARRLPGRLDRSSAQDAAFVGLALAFGDPTYDVDGGTADIVEQALGLGRARSDRIADGDPWLDGSIEGDLVSLARVYSFAGLREGVASATAADLEAVRTRARFLALDQPAAIRAAELYEGKNVGGLGFQRQISSAPEAAVAFALLFTTMGLGGQLDEQADAAAQHREETAEQIRLAERYVVIHPEQRAAIWRVGLMGLHHKGLLVPLPPNSTDDAVRVRP